MASTERSDKSAAELTGDFTRQITSLVHHEIELAKVELTDKGRRAGVGSGLLAAAGLAAFLGLLCLTGLVIAALDLVLSLWLAILIVAVVYFAASGALAIVGRRRLREATPPTPTGAIESTKEDVEWLKAQARSMRP